MMKDAAGQSPEESAAKEEASSASSRLVHALQAQVRAQAEELAGLRRGQLDESDRHEQAMLASRAALVDAEQRLGRSESQVAAEKSKHEKCEAVIREIKSSAASVSERYEAHLLEVENNASKVVFSLEEQIANLSCERESEREQLLTTHSELTRTCDEYLSQLQTLRSENEAYAVKYETLLSDANSLQKDMAAMELKEKETQENIYQQQLFAANSASEVESRYVERIAEHVQEQEKLSVLLQESTANFTSLSEKYSCVMTSRAEAATRQEQSHSAQLTSVKEECGKLR
jgi:hypothetical protein